MSNSVACSIQGVYAALVTPRRPDSTEADTAALLEYIDAVTNAGVNGLVLFGATGEFVHFDIGERTRVAALAIKRSRVPVLVNVSHSSLAGAGALAENAQKVGASGLLVMPPYFYRYADQQIADFFELFLRIAEPRIPVLLYNLPAYTSPISSALAERFLSTGKVAGIKDSSGDWSFFEHLLNLRTQKNFALMVGHEAIYRQGRSACADGIVSGISAAFPELIVALDRAIQSHSDERAGLLAARLAELMEQIGRFPGPLAIKAAAIARGWLSEHFALPADSQTARDLQVFSEWFRTWLPVALAEARSAVGRA